MIGLCSAPKKVVRWILTSYVQRQLSPILTYDACDEKRARESVTTSHNNQIWDFVEEGQIRATRSIDCYLPALTTKFFFSTRPPSSVCFFFWGKLLALSIPKAYFQREWWLEKEWRTLEWQIYVCALDFQGKCYEDSWDYPLLWFLYSLIILIHIITCVWKLRFISIVWGIFLIRWKTSETNWREMGEWPPTMQQLLW